MIFQYGDGFFRERPDCRWEEIKNNQLFAMFDFVKLNQNSISNKESLVIYANDRDFFIEIFETQAFWGSKNSIKNFLINGIWKMKDNLISIYKIYFFKKLFLIFN
jgi:hypothetical protein